MKKEDIRQDINLINLEMAAYKLNGNLTELKAPVGDQTSGIFKIVDDTDTALLHTKLRTSILENDMKNRINADAGKHKIVPPPSPTTTSLAQKSEVADSSLLRSAKVQVRDGN